MLLPFQQRVVEEKADLDGRLVRLQAFLATPAFASMAGRDRQLLALQERLMIDLSAVLLERIERFEKLARAQGSRG